MKKKNKFRTKESKERKRRRGRKQERKHRRGRKGTGGEEIKKEKGGRMSYKERK